MYVRKACRARLLPAGVPPTAEGLVAMVRTNRPRREVARWRGIHVAAMKRKGDKERLSQALANVSQMPERQTAKHAQCREAVATTHRIAVDRLSPLAPRQRTRLSNVTRHINMSLRQRPPPTAVTMRSQPATWRRSHRPVGTPVPGARGSEMRVRVPRKLGNSGGVVANGVGNKKNRVQSRTRVFER